MSLHHDNAQGHSSQHDHSEWRVLTALAAACGSFGLLGFAAGHALPQFLWVSHALYFAAILAGGWDAAKDSWENLRARRPIDIHFLMLVVALGAVAIGAWGEAVLLLFLFSASGAMEGYAMDRTQSEISALFKSAPKTALRIDSKGGEAEVPVDDLCLGDRVRVKPGSLFPTDGEVVAGQTSSDESMLTGESVPIDKGPGDAVLSGTLNLWGAVDFTVTQLPSESTLQKVIRLIQTAQKLRAPSERFTQKFGPGYTYGVIAAAALLFLVLWLGLGVPAFANTEETSSAFYRAMTLLVVASPCALVLSIPSAILAAIAWGARHGVLFRGGAAIERLARVTAVAFDKTGTLTTGELAVVGCESIPAGCEREVLELSYALEANSQHPIARAIVAHAKNEALPLREIDGFESLTGQGVKAGIFPVDERTGLQREARKIKGSATLGRKGLFEGDADFYESAEQFAPAPEATTEVWLRTEGLVGRILLLDEAREASRPVLRSLRELGLKTVMLTGDRRPAAEAVARKLGLSEVRAALSPEGKVAAIQTLRGEGYQIAMLGDGVNDAPSLAAADVGVAMGARGSDAALEQAELVLMHDKIENFLAALRLSRRAAAVIRQNLVISLGVVGAMVVATLLGVVPLWLGVAAHEGSTFLVVANSLRLLLGRHKEDPPPLLFCEWWHAATPAHLAGRMKRASYSSPPKAGSDSE